MDIENKCSACTARMNSCKTLKYQLLSTEKIELPVVTEPGQEKQIDFSGKLHKKQVTGEPNVLIGIIRYSKWPVVWIRKSTEPKEVINFLESSINLSGVAEKIKSEGSAFESEGNKTYCENKNIEIEYSPPRLHTGTGAVECAKQNLKILINANLKDKIGLTESENRALRVMRFTIYTGLDVSPFEFHHGRNPRTELTSIVKDN